MANWKSGPPCDWCGAETIVCDCGLNHHCTGIGCENNHGSIPCKCKPILSPYRKVSQKIRGEEK